MLLPVDIRDWLPDNHLVWFVLDAVDELDVNVLERHRRIGGAGACGYDPRMLIALVIYAYRQGTRSSRQRSEPTRPSTPTAAKTGSSSRPRL
jgi:transposase